MKMAGMSGGEFLQLAPSTYIPQNASIKIKTVRGKNDPAPLARSKKGLEDTGELTVRLPMKSLKATVYMCFAIIGRIALFGCVSNERGDYVPALEEYTVTAKDVLENGIFSGRLNPKYRDMGLQYMEVGSAVLPEIERQGKKKEVI